MQETCEIDQVPVRGFEVGKVNVPEGEFPNPFRIFFRRENVTENLVDASDL